MQRKIRIILDEKGNIIDILLIDNEIISLKRKVKISVKNNDVDLEKISNKDIIKLKKKINILKILKKAIKKLEGEEIYEE